MQNKKLLALRLFSAGICTRFRRNSPKKSIAQRLSLGISCCWSGMGPRKLYQSKKVQETLLQILSKYRLNPKLRDFLLQQTFFDYLDLNLHLRDAIAIGAF